MPATKNAVIRYMFLDQMLSDRYNKYTCEKLLEKVNEKLEFAGYPLIGGDRKDYDRHIRSGKRVIQLDLQALQDSPFNMEIDSSDRLDGKPVYRYADQTQSLFSKQISDEEKRLLQEVLNTLGQFSGLDNFEWLRDLQEKLNAQDAFGRGELDQDNQLKRRIISFSANEYLQGRNYLGTLFSLISNKKVVDIAYQPYGEKERKIRLYPYLLKQYNDRWYLIGTPLATDKYPYRRDFYINLPLDRINGIDKVDGLDYIECEEGFEERYEEIVGITYNEQIPLTRVVLAIKNTYVPYLETKPLHGSQTKLSQEEQSRLHKEQIQFDNYTFYTLEIKPNREFYNLMFRNGENIILISPSSLRDKMVQEYKRILDLLMFSSR